MKVCIEDVRRGSTEYLGFEQPESPEAAAKLNDATEVATPGVRMLPSADVTAKDTFTLPRGFYVSGRTAANGRRVAGGSQGRIVEYDLEEDDEEVLEKMKGVDEDKFEAAMEALEDKSWAKMFKAVKVPPPSALVAMPESKASASNAASFQTPKSSGRAFSVDFRPQFACLKHILWPFPITLSG